MAVAEQTGEYQEERTNKERGGFNVDGVGRGTTGALFVRDFSLLYCIAGKISLNNTKGGGQREGKK